MAAAERAGDGEIDANHLPLPLLQAALGESAGPAVPKLPALDVVLEQVERRMIQLALAKTGGNQSKAADLLTVWRPRLHRRLKALGLASPPDADGEE
jgi:DNA-binding NtrC family response regulator